ncbi:MAG TPA: hypothetical protein VG056_13700, partial [Pirellulales bacterium]|nr:hypothetical protein [Pirellulales bacterium]
VSAQELADQDVKHVHESGEHDEFRFADEHSLSASDFGEVGHPASGMGADGSHHFGGVAAMAAKPPQQKRKTPLSVRLIGIGIFFGFGVLGCVIVYSAFLYFGISDLFGIQKYFPDWVVAKSLREPMVRPSNKTQRDTKPLLSQGPNDSGRDAIPTPSDGTTGDEQKNRPPADSATLEKPAAADGAAGGSADAAANGPAKTAPTDASAQTPGKADAAAGPPEVPPKPADSGASKEEPRKGDLLGDSNKPPSLDLPPVKLGPNASKTPADSAAETPVERRTEKPIEKPADAIAPKSDVAYSLDELNAAIEVANGSSAALAQTAKSGNADELKKARIAHYKVMSHLATVLTFAKAPAAGEPADWKSRAIASLTALSAATTPAEQDAIGSLAATWIDSPWRKESGLFAAGRLEAIESHGKLFELQLELPGGTSLTIVTPEKPKVEERGAVLLLGAIVNDPAKNLPGYEGKSDMVVFADLVVAPPKTDASPAPAADVSEKPPKEAAKPPAGDSAK